MKNKKKGEIETRKLISAIILVIVIVVVVLAVSSQAKGGIIDKFTSLFPDFFKTNSTAKPPVECPIGYNEVGYIDAKEHINLNGKKTNLYHLSGKIYLKLPVSYNIFGGDYEIGYVIGNKIAIDFPKDWEIEYRKLFPEEEDRRFLNDADIFEGTICLAADKYNKFIEKDKCILTCGILNGECSASPVNGKTAFKKLDCLSGQLCYVNESEKIPDSSNLHIKKDSFFEYNIGLNNGGKKLDNILETNKITVALLDKIRLNIISAHDNAFCYSFDVDNEDVKPVFGYVDGKEDYAALRSDIMSYSGEKILSFAAWNNGLNDKVIVRWRIETKAGAQTIGGNEIIKDSEFSYKIINAPAGAILYVAGVRREWSIGAFSKRSLLTYDYKIVKVSSTEIRIYAADREKNTWHELYCNKGKINLTPWYSMKIGRISDSLSETLDKNCEWDW